MNKLLFLLLLIPGLVLGCPEGTHLYITGTTTVINQNGIFYVPQYTCVKDEECG